MTTATQAAAPCDRASLYFKEGSSDKEYHAAIEHSGDGFVVTFAYGRRGSTLTTGTKTSAPVNYGSARKTFDKLIAEKIAKGYTPGPAPAPAPGSSTAGSGSRAEYQHAEREARATGVLPQLLNPIEDETVGFYIRDAQWWAQEKFDGKRVLIRRNGDEVTGINRRGLTIALPTPIVEHARKLAGFQCLLDGEAVGDAFFAFDLLEHDGRDMRGEPYSVRLNTLYWLQPPSHHMHVAPAPGAAPEPGIRCAATAYGSQAKETLYHGLRSARREGVVFKRRDAAYTPGRPASGGPALKLKFTATASCIVGRPNGTKRSVPLILFDGAQAVGVGNVTIPPNHEVPRMGEVVEVRYYPELRLMPSTSRIPPEPERISGFPMSPLGIITGSQGRSGAGRADGIGGLGL